MSTMTNDELEMSQGFNENDMTLRFAYNNNCSREFTSYRNDDTLESSVNIPTLIQNSLDWITELTYSDKLSLYIVKDDVIGLNKLYRVIDSPLLTYDTELNKVKEDTVYYYDKTRNVCIGVRYIYKGDLKHYARVVHIFASYSSNKEEQINSFLCTHCTTEPAVNSEGLSPAEYRKKFTNPSSLS